MKQENKETQRDFIRWLKEQGVSERKALMTLSIVSLLSFVAQLVLFWQLTQWVQKAVVDQAIKEAHSSLLISIAVIMIAILLFERIKQWLSVRCEARLYSTLQDALFEKLSLEQHALVRSKSTFFWQQIWLHHIPTIVAFNVHYLVQQRFVMAVPFIVLACVFAINWVIGLSLAMSLPVVPLFMIVIGKGASALHQKHFKALARLGSIFVDRIKALQLLRIFNAHDSQAKILSSASDSLNHRTMNVVGVAFLSATALDFFSTLAVALVAVFVGFNLLGEFTWGGQLNLHTGLFLLLTAPLCFAELKQLGRLYHMRAEALAVAETLQPIFSQSNHEPNNIIKDSLPDSLRWVNFKAEAPPLTAQEITITKGNWIWLQGASGSGKTCFLESLMGQRDTSHALDNAVLISQHAVIKPISIRDNLRLDNSYSDDAISQAIQAVELNQWVAQQPTGLDAVLTEEIPLSGGQKQRLALARALLTDAEIILLDEPTAHLTDDQHQRISMMIHSTFKHKTVIWASHKPLNEEWFDKTWSIAGGELLS